MTQGEQDDMLIEMHGLLTQVHTWSKDNHKTLHGNGQPGLVKEFEIVRTKQRECQQHQKFRTTNMLAGSAIFIAAATMVIQLLNTFF